MRGFSCPCGRIPRSADGVATCYKIRDGDLFSKHTEDKRIYLEYDGDKNDNRVPDPDDIGIHKLKGDGAASGAA